jgi:GGDEF domain-containing protein
LSEHDTFNDFGYMVSIKISDYDIILKEYEENVGNKLLKLVSDYMIEYLQENHLRFEIVRYSEDNFLIFIYERNEEDVEEHMVNMQKSMSNYKFKQRHKVFNLTFYFAVMQYLKNESFSSVLDQLDEQLFLNKI